MYTVESFSPRSSMSCSRRVVKLSPRLSIRLSRLRAVLGAAADAGTAPKRYHLPSKQLQSRMACKSGMNFQGRPIRFDLVDDWGYPIPQEDLYVPHFRTNCETCGSKLICNGCSDCGKCL